MPLNALNETWSDSFKDFHNFEQLYFGRMSHQNVCHHFVLDSFGDLKVVDNQTNFQSLFQGHFEVKYSKMIPKKTRVQRLTDLHNLLVIIVVFFILLNLYSIRTCYKQYFKN